MKRTTLILLLLAALFVFGSTTGFCQKGKSVPPKKDPFAKPGTPVKAEEDVDRSISILVEYIKVDHLTANKMIREFGPKAAEANKLREQLDKMIEEGKAELLETAWLCSRSGQRSKTESVREVIYPTEWDPAEIPTHYGDTERKAPRNPAPNQNQNPPPAKQDVPVISPDVPFTNPNPAAWETRNVGVTLEADCVLDKDNRKIDVNLAPEFVERLEDEHMAREGYEKNGRGLEHVRMPTFYTMRDTTAILTVSGQYHLLGIHTPHDDKKSRVLVLLRADVVIVK